MTNYGPASDLAFFTDADAAVARIAEIYERSVTAIRERFVALTTGKPSPPPGAANYPFVGMTIDL